MEEYMRESMRKLALWYTRTFKPIMTHEELDPLMATLGFVAVASSGAGSSAWKEYVYCSAGERRRKWVNSPAEPAPRPRLPFPRVDGLHIYTYMAFIDAVNFYLGMSDVSDLFHIRGMPLSRIHDRNRKWRRMEEEESGFVYREGTLDQATHRLYHFNNKTSNTSSDNGGSSPQNYMIRDKSRGNNNGGNPSLATCFIPLKDIIF